MEDFGTLLPFNYVRVPADECYIAYYIRLHHQKTAWRSGIEVLYPEQWAYFAWLPRSIAAPRLKAPAWWGIVDEIPHEHLFVHIRRAPVYFIPWDDESVEATMLEFIIEEGNSADWLVRELEMRRAALTQEPRNLDFPFERFVRRVLRADRQCRRAL
jgi:hypothetical protein